MVVFIENMKVACILCELILVLFPLDIIALNHFYLLRQQHPMFARLTFFSLTWGRENHLFSHSQLLLRLCLLYQNIKQAVIYCLFCLSNLDLITQVDQIALNRHITLNTLTHLFIFFVEDDLPSGSIGYSMYRQNI